MNLSKKNFRTSIIFKSGIASLDQAIISALSFIISIILIKTVSKLEYGYYSIAFSISLFLISVQNAVINTPLAVLLITKKGSDKKKYAASLCYGQFIVILPAVLIGTVTVFLLCYWGLDSKEISVAVAFCMAVIGILFREFLRAYFFAEENPLNVLKLDIVYVFCLLGFIAIAYIAFGISVAAIFALMGLSGLLASLLFSRKQGWRSDLKTIRESFSENWKFGKWALFGVLVTHIQNYSYIYLLGALLGSNAVAEVSAARLLLMPLALVQAGWCKIAVPHGSKLREQSQTHRFFKEQILVSTVFVVGIAIYVGFLSTFSNVLQKFLFTENYAYAINYSLIWGAIFAIQFLALNASFGLQVMKNFHTISKVNLLTMLVTVGCSYFFIRSHGVDGGLIALIIGGTLLAVSLWLFFAKMVFYRFEREPVASIKERLMFKLSKSVAAPLIKDCSDSIDSKLDYKQNNSFKLRR